MLDNDTPTTPPANIFPPSGELSPPNSQGGPLPTHLHNTDPIPFSPLSGNSAKMAPSQALNANGKRSWKENGGKGAKGEGKEEGTVHVQQETGYTWKRDEDAPGWAWMNVKAREEAQRAYGQVVEKERMIKSKLHLGIWRGRWRANHFTDKYGDVLLEK
jgi:hypothetical protein